MLGKIKNTFLVFAVQSLIVMGLWTFAHAQPMPGDALVADLTAGTGGRGALFSVDLTTGNRTLISNFGNGAQGPLGIDPRGVTLFTKLPQSIVDAFEDADIDPTIVPESVLNSLITADESGLLEVTPSDVVASDNFDLQQDAALVLGSGSQSEGNIQGNEFNTVVVGTDAAVAGNIEGIGSLVFSSGATQVGNLINIGTLVFVDGATVTIGGNVEFLNELQMGEDANINVNGNLVCSPTATVIIHPTATINVNGNVECLVLL